MDNLDLSMSTAFTQNLYHYTSLQSLMSMIESDQPSLWAGCVSYLNDSEEFRHALDLLDNRLSLKFQAIVDQRKFDTAEYLVYSHLYEVLQFKLGETVFPYYVFSLSEEPDLLSQWRSYTPHGSGVSIGFSPDQIKAIIKDNNLSLQRCIYTHTEKVEYIDGLLDTFLIVATTYHSEFIKDNSLDLYTRVESLLVDIFRALLCIKHEGFSEEKEWRLISHAIPSASDQIKYRIAGGMLSPYIEANLNEPPVFSRLTLGPSAHIELSKASLDAYMRRKTLCEMPAPLVSDIPYREW